jgi:hypothetical protein
MQVQEISIEINPASVLANQNQNQNQNQNLKRKQFFLNVENIDLKSLCSIRSLFDIDRPLNDYRLFNTKESVAHYKAHIDAWKYIVDNNIKVAHIKDNTCSEDSGSGFSFASFQNVSLDAIPWMQGDLFLVDYDELPDTFIEEKSEETEETEEEKEREWFRLQNIFHGLNEYYITNQGARFLLRYALPVEMRIDSFVGTLAHLYPKEFSVFYFKNNSNSADDTENSNGKNKIQIKEKEKEKKSMKNNERNVEGRLKKKPMVTHLKNNRLEVPFLHNHPRHTRPSNPMSNIPMFLITILFFGILRLSNL